MAKEHVFLFRFSVFSRRRSANPPPLLLLSSTLTMGRTCFQLVKHKQVLASVLTSWIKAMQNCPNDPVGGDEVPACEGYSSPSAKVSVSLAGLISTHPALKTSMSFKHLEWVGTMTITNNRGPNRGLRTTLTSHRMRKLPALWPAEA